MQAPTTAHDQEKRSLSSKNKDVLHRHCVSKPTLYAPTDIPNRRSFDSRHKVELQVKRFIKAHVLALECRMRRIGIDIGGTFTVVPIDSQTGEVWSAKVPTTPKDSTLGAINGLRVILERSKSEARVDRLHRSRNDDRHQHAY
jgi:Hydantoinase/oxoprolinase N-terminal region